MLRRQFSIFLVVGFSTVVVDYITYRLLLTREIFGLDTAKTVSFLVGTLYAYFANRYWTFSSSASVINSVGRFIVLYSVTLFANVAVNSSSLKIMQTIPYFSNQYLITISFMVSTAVSASLNFFGMKFWVFQPSTKI